MLPANAEVVYAVEEEEWLDSLRRAGDTFDVIAVDSAYRGPSSQVAPSHLSPRGVIVWDNSLHPTFPQMMREVFGPAGFRELPFVGLACPSYRPSTGRRSCTATATASGSRLNVSLHASVEDHFRRVGPEVGSPLECASDGITSGDLSASDITLGYKPGGRSFPLLGPQRSLVRRELLAELFARVSQLEPIVGDLR